MTTALQEQNVYLAEFDRSEKDLQRVGSPSVHRLRKAAMARFAELGFPKARDEEWRFTNLAAFLEHTFERGPQADGDAEDVLGSHDLADLTGTVLVCSDGQKPWVQHAGASLPAGVKVAGLAEGLAQAPQLIEPHLGRYADYKNNAFNALNTAFLQEGAWIYVPKGVAVDTPITILYQAKARGRSYFWPRRGLIVAEANSRVQIIERFLGSDNATYFTSAVTEIVVGPGASVDHYRVLEEGNEAFHIAGQQIQQERDSRFSSHNVTLKGGFVRNDANAVLGGEGCECTLNGLYTGNGSQLVDNHTFIDHAKPRCASHELYKGILDGRARGVFNGKILVRQDAQKTDAKQTNKTLLLSDDATINTKPQLEIYADDVKCTHGATVGQLDAEALFYMRARGIGLQEARNLLTFAFANDIIGRIQVPALRESLERSFLARQHLSDDTKEKV